MPNRKQHLLLVDGHIQLALGPRRLLGVAVRGRAHDDEGAAVLDAPLDVARPVCPRGDLLAHEHGVPVIPPATGAHYATIAGATSAQNIVEVGTAFGVSGLWLLRGAPGAILTSIDDGYDRQEQAKPLFAEAGCAANQIRLITGRASDVLPRLNENAYDVVVVDGDPAHVATYVEHALRLVRVGGVVMVPHVLWKGEVSDPTKRGAIPTAFRKMLLDVRDGTDLVSSMSPLGDGLLTITKLA